MLKQNSATVHCRESGNWNHLSCGCGCTEYSTSIPKYLPVIPWVFMKYRWIFEQFLGIFSVFHEKLREYHQYFLKTHGI